MLTFNKPYWQTIAEVSTQPEFQNVEVQLIDPSALTTDENYDVETGEYTDTPEPFWSGPARLVSQRWGVNRENSETANSNTRTSILLQFGYAQNFGTDDVPLHRIRRGTVMYVTECESNPALLTRVFTCTSDMQSGASAARTLEFETDGDAVKYG